MWWTFIVSSSRQARLRRTGFGAACGACLIAFARTVVPRFRRTRIYCGGSFPRAKLKAVIPAAGLGSRFLPYTNAMPKEMIPIVDKHAIQFVVEEAVASGMRVVLIATGRSKRAMQDHSRATW